MNSKRDADDLPLETVRIKIKKPRTNLSKSLSTDTINKKIFIDNDNSSINNINNIDSDIIDNIPINNETNSSDKTEKQQVNDTNSSEMINKTETQQNNTYTVNLVSITNKIDQIILQIFDMLNQNNKLSINEISVKIAHNHDIDNIIKLYKRVTKEDLVYLNINTFNYFIVLLKILIRTKHYTNSLSNIELNNTLLIHLFNIVKNLVTYNEYIITNTSSLVLRHTSNNLLIEKLYSFNNELYELSQALMEFNYSSESSLCNNIVTNIKNTSVELFNLSCISGKIITNLLIDIVTVQDTITKK